MRRRGAQTDVEILVEQHCDKPRFVDGKIVRSDVDLASRLATGGNIGKEVNELYTGTAVSPRA